MTLEQKRKSKMIFKVFTKDKYGYENYTFEYCYEDALAQRSLMQELGSTKVMIKRWKKKDLK